MDRSVLQRHLEQAERHVADGEKHLRQQREIIAQLEQDGHDATLAKEVLARFETLQAMHVEDRERLRRTLTDVPN